MKFRSTSSDSRVRSLRLLLALACLLPLLALAVPPGWWTDRQVLDPNAAKNEFGSVNQGQLKNMAKKAYAELRNALPSEIWTTSQGQALAALVDSWNPAQTGNFDIINQGQLKAVAKKFYDVLILHGYTDAYPWTGATTAAANDALANLGQLKNLFSFDLTRDSDGDGIPDWQETKFNLNPFNGQTNLTLPPPPPPPPLLIGVPNDWQGWTRIGRSDDPGLYGSGSTSALYDVYANQFYLNAALGASSIPVGNQYVTGDPTGLFTYSPGAFTGGNRILGIGVQGLDGANVSGFTPTVRFDLGNDSYSAATNVEAGRTSFSLYSHSGDFTVQFQPVGVGGSSIYRPSNITFRGDDNVVYTLPGGIGSGASYDFAFRAIPLTSSNSYQMFFDLDAMQSLYSNVSLFQATFNRPNVMVAPGTNYYGQGIGTIGSTVTIALNGLSNNNTVFSVNAPPPLFVAFDSGHEDKNMNQGFDPPMQTDSYEAEMRSNTTLLLEHPIIRDKDPDHPENWVWWTSLGKGPGIADNKGLSPDFNVNRKVRALLHDAATAQLCEIVVVDHADIVSVHPTLPTQPVEPLTIWCTAANGGHIEYATIQIRTRKDHVPIVTLKVMVMPVPTQLIPVKLYAIPDSDHPVATALKPPPNGVPDPALVQAELNARFYQACLQFDVQTVANPNPVRWDLNEPLNKLNLPDATEADVFRNDPQFNGHIPVIFVREIDSAKTVGFNTREIDKRRIIMDDSKVPTPLPPDADGSQESRVRFIAHEVGHFFDLSWRGRDYTRYTGALGAPMFWPGDRHDKGPFPPGTAGLMKPESPGEWLRHEDWELMSGTAKTMFPNLFPQ